MSHKNYNYPTDIPQIFKLFFDNYNKEIAPMFEGEYGESERNEIHERFSSEKEYVKSYCDSIARTMWKNNVDKVRIRKKLFKDYPNNPTFYIQKIDNKPCLISHITVNSHKNIFQIELTELYPLQIHFLFYLFCCSI